MKRTTTALVLIFFMGYSNSSFAQDGSKVGIKGGLNFSNFHSTDDDVDDQNLRLGFQAGLFFKAALTDFLAIQPEILYTTKGAKYDYNLGAFGDGELTQKFGYLQVPVLAVLNLGENLNVHAGPYFAYMLNAKVENDADNNDFDFTEEFDTDDFERFDYGISFGAAIELDIIRVGARYDYGLSEVGKEQSFSINNSTVTSNFFKSQKNSVLSLYLGLSF